jgi:LPXTG-site transpeptidase (sortase) family protein
MPRRPLPRRRGILPMHPAFHRRAPMSFQLRSVRLAHCLERLLLAVALLSLGLWSWTWLDSSVYNMVQGRRLDGILGSESLDPPGSSTSRLATATRREVLASGLIGRIQIPRFHVHALLIEGTDPRALRRAVGHVPATALPGEPGNVVIAGHRDSFFSYLKDVQPGDRVWITTPDGKFEYSVESMRVVRPEQTEVLGTTPIPTLTLITCYPFHHLGPAPERYVVSARLIAQPHEASSQDSRSASVQAIASERH